MLDVTGRVAKQPPFWVAVGVVLGASRNGRNRPAATRALAGYASAGVVALALTTASHWSLAHPQPLRHRHPPGDAVGVALAVATRRMWPAPSARPGRVAPIAAS